jgi:hypothetical protein
MNFFSLSLFTILSKQLAIFFHRFFCATVHNGDKMKRDVAPAGKSTKVFRCEFAFMIFHISRAGYLSRYSEWLRAGRSGDRIPVGTRFAVPIQSGPGAHPASCTISTRSFPVVESGRGVTLTPHPLPVTRSKKQSRAIPLLSLRAFVAYKKGET